VAYEMREVNEDASGPTELPRPKSELRTFLAAASLMGIWWGYRAIPASYDNRAVLFDVSVLLWVLAVGVAVVLQERASQDAAARKAPAPVQGATADYKLWFSILDARINRVRSSVDSQRQLCVAILGVDAAATAFIAANAELLGRLSTLATGLSGWVLGIEVFVSVVAILMGAMSASYRPRTADGPSPTIGEIESALRGEEAALAAAEASQTAYLYLGVIIQVAVVLTAVLSLSTL
jgi:hypothetical protein